MIQKYIRHATQKVLEILDGAMQEAVSANNSALTPEILLLALLAQPESEALEIIDRITLDGKTAKKEIVDRIYATQPQNPPAKEPPQMIATEKIGEVLRIAPPSIR